MSLLTQIFSNESNFKKDFFENLMTTPYIHPLRMENFKSDLRYISTLKLKPVVARYMLFSIRNVIITNINNKDIYCEEILGILLKYYNSDYLLLNEIVLTSLCYLMNNSDILNENILNSHELDFVNTLFLFLDRKITFSNEFLHTSLTLINKNILYFDNRFYQTLFNIFINVKNPFLSSKAIETLTNLATPDEIRKILPELKPKLCIYKKNNNTISAFIKKYYSNV